MAEIVHIGTSGWSYPHWKGCFFPAGLPTKDQLRYTAERMDALEINTSFYGAVHPDTFIAWQRTVADLAGFRFAVKGSRYITHMKKLRGARPALANFFATGPLLLGEHLGPILWQLPPQLAFDAALMDDFLALLPRTAAAAQRRARRHDPRFTGRASARLGPGLSPDATLQYAVEPRHPSFDSDAFLELLERHQVAAVTADTAGKHVVVDAVTAPFAYLRLHGSRRLYGSRYTDAELASWADRIRASRARELWVFFDNDARAHAARDAMRLRGLLHDLLDSPSVRRAERRRAPPPVDRAITDAASRRARKAAERGVI